MHLGLEGMSWSWWGVWTTHAGSCLQRRYLDAGAMKGDSVLLFDLAHKDTARVSLWKLQWNAPYLALRRRAVYYIVCKGAAQTVAWRRMRKQDYSHLESAVIVTIARSCVSAQLWEASLCLHLWGNPHSSPSFPAMEEFPLGTITAACPACTSAGGRPGREGPVIWSFTVLGDAAVYGWCWEQPLLCRCTEDTLRSPSSVSSSQSWHQTATNRKGQASPLSWQRCECVSSSPVLPGSLHISHMVSHHGCCTALRYHCALASPLLLSRGQDWSIWLHCNLWAGYGILGQTERLVVDRGSLDDVMPSPLDYLSRGHDAKRQDHSLDVLLLPAPPVTPVSSSNLPTHPLRI